MGDRTAIEWTDATWNPVRGCSRVSEGCRHCYAEVVAARFSGPGLPYEGLAKRVGGEARWTGKVRMVPEHLADPLRWKKPRRIFVNSMSDLFHEGLSDHDISRVFDVITATPRHVYQILTKRPARMRRYFLSNARFSPTRPLPNVWLGVSVEDQGAADERIPLLLACPAAVRFVSYEPALGPVDFTRVGACRGEPLSALEEIVGHVERPRLDWLIVGGESGPGARSFDVAWAREAVRQCREAGVACFVKQLGARPFGHGQWPCPAEGCSPASPCPHRPGLGLRDRKGGDWSEWPEDLRVREYPATPAA